MFKVDFLIVGAPKAGTSTLHNWLNQHPELEGSDPKETYAFLSSNFKAYNRFGVSLENIDNLKKFFTGTNKIIYESSVQTLYSLDTIDSIKSYNPSIKIIVVKRDPVKRILSTYNYYKFTKNLNNVHETFELYIEALLSRECNTGNDLYDKALEWSNYDYYINKWKVSLGEANIFETEFENLFTNPKEELNEIQRFLGVKNLIDSSVYSTKENESLNFKNKKIHHVVSRMSTKMKDSRLRRIIRHVYRKINSQPIENTDKLVAPELTDKINSALALLRRQE